jgi:dTDP-4-dehydrorhamnose 3,5-epimerase
MIQIRPTAIPGCLELLPEVKPDARGRFFKTFHSDVFASHGLETKFLEEYFSWSKAGVIRGMHFQTPPHEHTKIVSCLIGSVMDVVVDLRKGSPTFGKAIQLILSAKQANMLYIPSGLAHGFGVLEGEALMHYKVSNLYAPQHDAGIRWDSLGIAWGIKNPIMSERDQSLERLETFQSPFTNQDLETKA